MTEVGDDTEKFVAVFDFFDALEVRLDGFESEFFEAIGVHRGKEKVANLLFGGIGLGFLSAGGIEDFVDEIPVALLEFGEGGPTRFVGWDGIVFEPVTVGVVKEVGVGRDRFVHVINGEARNFW